jgi:chromosome segregation ATPase
MFNIGTLILEKVGDSISRQKQMTENEVESLKIELNEKDKLLQEANRQNMALECRVKELEETIRLVNASMNLLQSENIQLESQEEENSKLLQESTIQKLVLEENFKGLGDSLTAVKIHFESLRLQNKQLQQERDRAVSEFEKTKSENNN